MLFETVFIHKRIQFGSYKTIRKPKAGYVLLELGREKKDKPLEETESIEI